MKCKYCHNVTLLEQTTGFFAEEAIFEFLNSRIGLIEGVVLSGGECSLGGNEIVEFVRKIKTLGLKTKIDTNGLNYNFIKNLLRENLIDFIALDYKSPREKFDFITGTTGQYDNFVKSLELIVNSDIEKEIRTTVHTNLLNEEDVNNIIRDIEKRGYRGNFYIQNFRNDSGNVRWIGEQSVVLNKEKIVKSELIEIKYRNFF
jgi:pyruvate formate lyase activating enzyme